MNNYPNIAAEECIVGKNTIIDPSANIRGLNGKAKRIVIGDNCYIGQNVQIICDDFKMGDYSKIQHHCNIHGYKPCHIGHNLWIGQYSIIDSIGGTTIGNNCGIGAHSQLWSHIKYGDTLEGCRFLSEAPLKFGHDVWMVGHCIVSPIVAADKSMALVGAVVTKDMAYNQIYSGVPAKSISNKIGNQFQDVSLDDKFAKMQEYLKEYKAITTIDTSHLLVIMSQSEIKDDERTYFVINDRTYTKRQTDVEIGFMKFLLPSKAKFVPM